jgi:hypothetical protein
MTVLIIVVVLAGVLGYYNKARFQLDCWMFNYPVDEALDMLLERGLRSGILSVEINTSLFYELRVQFKNGDTMKAWNCNKYYGWVSRGSMGAYRVVLV